MKKDRLLEIIREEINEALNVLVTTKDGKTTPMPYNTQDEKESIDALKPDSNVINIKTTAGKNIKEEDLNEIPDFGGQLDQGVAAKYGEEDTLQKAVDEIVDETLKDMGVTLEDLKKDKDKATETLNSIREKVLGAKRKNIPQDPRVIKALKKQEDIEVDKLGSISGKSLQQNQTDNAIKKALGLVTPGKQGRKADPNKAEKPAKEKAPKAEKTPKTKVTTRTKGDDGFDTVSYVDKEEAKAAAAAEKADKALGGKYAANLSPEDESQYKEYKSDITSLVNDLENNKNDKLKMKELKLYLEDSEVRRLFKAKGVKLSDLVRSVIK